MTFQLSYQTGRQEERQADRQNEATIRQYGYDMDKWELDKEMIKQNRLHAMEEIRIKAANDGRVADYQDATNKAQYEYQLKIRDRQQASNEAQFQRSELIFSDQLSLNERSQRIAEDNEYRALEEIHTEQAFDQQEAYLDSLIAEGKLNLVSSNDASLDLEKMKIKTFQNNMIISVLGIVIVVLLVF